MQVHKQVDRHEEIDTDTAVYLGWTRYRDICIGVDLDTAKDIDIDRDRHIDTDIHTEANTDMDTDPCADIRYWYRH